MGPEGAISAAQDVLNLTRMNWNTADIRGNGLSRSPLPAGWAASSTNTAR